MKPELQQAFELLASQTSKLQLTRDEHIDIQKALDLLELEIIILSPKPEAPKEDVDKDKSLA